MAENKLPWYYTDKALALALVLVGPLALPLVWINPDWSPKKKIIWTIVIAVSTYIMFAVMKESFNKIMESYQQLKQMGL